MWFTDAPITLVGPVLFIATVLTFLVFYLTWSYVNMRFQRYLREPPKNWRSYLESAASAGAALPSFGEKTHTIRRQLILATASTGGDVSKLSTNKPLTVGKLPKDAFKPKYNDKGERANRAVIYGFFHPFADAGGGGERVLWAAVRSTLATDPMAVAAIYIAKGNGLSADSGDAVLERVEARFGIEVDKKRVVFVFLSGSSIIKAETWKHFTLIGQAIGSVILAYQAIALLVPDVYVDTAGYPFTYPIIDWLLQVPICAYVHYPVVQDDMLNKVRFLSFKWIYWRLFMFAYSFIARYCTLPVTNSSWTKEHLDKMWSRHLIRKGLITTVYPPCATQDFTAPTSEGRKPHVVYVAQFRSEKRHELVLNEFAKFVKQWREKNDGTTKPHLVLIGSIRGDRDSQTVYSLRLLARELELDEYTTFVLDAPWSLVQKHLSESLVGVNAMWNEHFGMVVVEYMAAGLIPVCHASAGPMMDIVTAEEGESERPGVLFTAKEDPDYVENDNQKSLSDALLEVYSWSDDKKQAVRERAYAKAGKFSDDAFDRAWSVRVRTLGKLESMNRKTRLASESFD